MHLLACPQRRPLRGAARVWQVAHRLNASVLFKEENSMSVLISEPSKNTKVGSNDNLPTAAYAAAAAKAALGPITIGRRAPRAHEVLIDILYCGICHSDIHQAREEGGGSIFPMVPGHKLAVVVSPAGLTVTKFKVGAKQDVGCFVDSCRHCAHCKSGHE